MSERTVTEEVAKHTPGPWRISDKQRLVVKEFQGWRWREIDMLAPHTGRHLSAVIVFGASTSDGKTMEADARLIAAAPDLLEASAFALSVLRATGLFELSERLAEEKLVAALAKADGPQ